MHAYVSMVAIAMLILVFQIGIGDGGSDDNNGAVIALAVLLAFSIIGLVISVMINIFLVRKLKQPRYVVTSRGGSEGEAGESPTTFYRLL